MADSESRIRELEARLNALESGGGQQGGRPSGQQGGGGGGTQPQDAGMVQAFLQGALVGNALQQAAPGGADQGGTAPAFLSIFGCDGGGWSPTNYDSVFWCRSRFLCNPSSLSCLC